MLRGIVGSSLRFPLLMVAIAAVVMVMGIGQIRQMPIDTLPEFNPPYVEVQTEALGLSAQEVEQLITVPLEADLLHGVAWLKRIESQSVTGLSSIVMTFEPGTDVTRARQVVAERLTQAHALPNVSKPPTMLQPLSSANRLLMIGMSSDKLSLIDLSVQARWTIRPRLMGVPGVANVSVWGQRDRQLQVQVDPARLRDHGVTLRQVIETTGNALWVSPLTFLDASTPGTGGFIDTANQRITIQHILPIRSPEDLGRVPIARDETASASTATTPLRLSDVANIVEDHQPLIGDAVVNDGQGLMLVVEKFPGANTLQVTHDVDEALAALAHGLNGVSFDSSLFRPATFIQSAVDDVSLAVLAGLLLIVVLLLAFLRSWRGAVIGLVTIPTSLVAALFVLALTGTTLNTMVICGLVLAATIVVNDVIVTTGIIQRRLSEARQMSLPTPRSAVILAAVSETHGPILFATLIVALATLPLLFVGGAVGVMLPSLLVPFALALVAALVVSVVVTPPLSLLLGAGRPRTGASAFGERTAERYGNALRWATRSATRVAAIGGLLAVAAVFVAGGVLAGHLGAPTVPTSRDRDLVISWNGAPGTSQPEMSRIVSAASAELRTTPGVRDVGGHVGRAVLSDRVVGANAGELWISIDPAADYDATINAVREVIAGYPGLSHAIATYSAQRMDKVLTGPTDDLIVRVYGQELGTLRPKAEEVRTAMAGIDGVVEPKLDASTEEPALQIQVDLASAERYGIKPGDVRRAAATLLSGIEAGSLFEDQKVFDVVVWSIPQVRQSLSTIQDLLIDTPSGKPVRLGDVASVTIGPAQSVIQREGVSRRLDIRAAIRGRDLEAVMQDVRSRLASIPFPLEYHAEILPGRAAQDQAGFWRMLLLFAAALAGTFLLLQAATGSWRLASGLVLALAAGLVGGALAIPADGAALSIGELVGFLAVLAIGARNGIALTGHYQRLERDEGVGFGLELVRRGARERLMPTLVTAFASALVVLPFVLLGDRPGYEVVRPMALVILGGVATSTFTSLFIVPAMYLLSGPSPEPDVASSFHLVEQPGVSPA